MTTLFTSVFTNDSDESRIIVETNNPSYPKVLSIPFDDEAPDIHNAAVLVYCKVAGITSTRFVRGGSQDKEKWVYVETSNIGVDIPAPELGPGVDDVLSLFNDLQPNEQEEVLRTLRAVKP